MKSARSCLHLLGCFALRYRFAGCDGGGPEAFGPCEHTDCRSRSTANTREPIAPGNPVPSAQKAVQAKHRSNRRAAGAAVSILRASPSSIPMRKEPAGATERTGSSATLGICTLGALPILRFESTRRVLGALLTAAWKAIPPMQGSYCQRS